MSIITTFESQCRALASVSGADENTSRFLVGTQSLNSENLIFLLEYKDDNNSLAKISFKFPFGESWHLSTSNRHPDLFADVTNQSVSLFRLPQEVQNPIEDDYGLSESPIEKLFDLVEGNAKLTRQCPWHPDDGDKLLICHDAKLEFWDIESQQRCQEFSISKFLDEAGDTVKNHKLPYVNDLRWSSLFNCSVVAATVGPKIYGIDTRISSICWLIKDSRCNRINSIDFNPNSQYYIATGGDDCRANFWDLRQTSKPVINLQPHTHWIWSIRYNPFHDQLVLSAGSDARVALMRVQSIASEPFGQSAFNEIDDEDEEDKEETVEATADGDELNHSGANSENSEPIGCESEKKSKEIDDTIIHVSEEHDDSVYAVEWATDPWVYASLGYESRLVINKVPKTEKFNILF